MTAGAVIAFFGLPGVGKSTLAKMYAAKIGAQVFLEPEEKDWADAVNSRDTSGHATAIHWFRAIRVPHLYQAQALKKRGEHAVVDSYFDKLCYYYLGQPGVEWLISPSDPYFSNVKRLAKLDLDLLPDADTLIYVSASESDWKKMIKKRNRKLDKSSQLASTYKADLLFRSAVRKYARKKSDRIRLVEFENRYGDAGNAVKALHNLVHL